LPREKLWVNFLANNQAIAERLGFAVDPAAHWPVTQSGCLTPCVICDAPESDAEFSEFKAADAVRQPDCRSADVPAADCSVRPVPEIDPDRTACRREPPAAGPGAGGTGTPGAAVSGCSVRSGRPIGTGCRSWTASAVGAFRQWGGRTEILR
jgi:hypothetical protein